MLRIYGKKKTESRFKAFDYDKGEFVNKLIYASLIQDADRDKADKVVKYMNTSNPEYIFKLVDIKGETNYE